MLHIYNLLFDFSNVLFDKPTTDYSEVFVYRAAQTGLALVCVCVHKYLEVCTHKCACTSVEVRGCLASSLAFYLVC